MAMTNGPTAKEIEDRLFQEIIHCQVVMQYLNDLYSPQNHHILSIATGYFNSLYVIKIDYLTAKLMRFFDPEKSAGKENFSIKKIHDLLPKLKLRNYSKDDTILKLKNYRNKYLSHNDFKKSRNSFPSYFNIKQDLEIAISYLFDALDEIRNYNGQQDTQLIREVSTHHDSSYYGLLRYGAYINAHKQDKDIRNLIKKSWEWHKEQENINNK